MELFATDMDKLDFLLEAEASLRAQCEVRSWLREKMRNFALSTSN